MPRTAERLGKCARSFWTRAGRSVVVRLWRQKQAGNSTENDLCARPSQGKPMTLANMIRVDGIHIRFGD
uniref:Uncharacterized protein n=1 Tax=Hyaloperonospora arabidopsidis (strain Emoy2) TaxID=559515 RepID=M4BLS8_HYAAE